MIKPPKIFVIKSNTSELKKVENYLREVFNYYKLSMQYFNKVFLCVSEAVVNSIEHGNKNDEKKNISVEIKYDKKELSIVVKDEGEGFDISKLPDPTLKRNIKKESGRGIHIIKSYCDKMEVDRNKSLICFKMDY